MKLSSHQQAALLMMSKFGGLTKDRAGWRCDETLWRASSGVILALERKGLCSIRPSGTGGYAQLTNGGRLYLREIVGGMSR